VDILLEVREREALKRVQRVDDPANAARGARDLLEQKTVQVEKIEDDLDEILEELRRQGKTGAGKTGAGKTGDL
jgi:hypothetical protein